MLEAKRTGSGTGMPGHDPWHFRWSALDVCGGSQVLDSSDFLPVLSQQ